MISALLGAVLIGLSLGLLGSGGSILTVPALIYLAHEAPRLAVAESLAVVGLISLIGLIPHALSGKLSWRLVLLFGLPGMLGTYLGSVVSMALSTAQQLSLFGVVLLLAAFFMFRPLPSVPPRTAPWTALQGLSVGFLTGLVGVGGGFLIVPALTLLAGLPMSLAIGTSLAIIALNSLVGFGKHWHLLHEAGQTLHWPLIAMFGGLGILGSLAGARLSQHISQQQLRRGFAVFLIFMGLFVLMNTLMRH